MKYTNPYTYHLGYEDNGYIRFIKLDECKEFIKLNFPSLHRLQVIDNFTMLFDEQSLLGFLHSKNLIAGYEKINLYIKASYKRGIRVNEVKNGIAYKESSLFFNTNNIYQFFNNYIDDPYFLEMAIDYFSTYLNVKSTENNTFIPSLIYLERYRNFLIKPFNRSKSEKARLSRFYRSKAISSLKFMSEYIMYKRKNGKFEYEEGTLIKKCNYKGFHDIAMFAYNTNKLLTEKKKREKAEKRKDIESRKIIKNGMQNELEIAKDNLSVASQNDEFEEYLTESEYESMNGKGLRRI